MKRLRQPSEMELQILSVLWKQGPLTVRQVLGAMPDGRARAYTSVLSVMQVMEKKGLLKHTSVGNVHVYRPAVERGKVLGGVVGRLVRHVFGGSAAAALQHLLEEAPPSAEEVAEMRKFLREHEEGRPVEVKREGRKGAQKGTEN